jgi:hypothetical protein
VAMMAAFEQARGPLPPPRRIDGNAALAALDVARHNDIRRQLGWRAFKSRSAKDAKNIGALAPDRFRALTDEVVKAALKNR